MILFSPLMCTFIHPSSYFFPVFSSGATEPRDRPAPPRSSSCVPRPFIGKLLGGRIPEWESGRAIRDSFVGLPLSLGLPSPLLWKAILTSLFPLLLSITPIHFLLAPLFLNKTNVSH